MSYLVGSDPEDVRDEDILKPVDKRVRASREDILDSIHGYEFIGVRRDKLRIIGTHE